MYNPQPSSRPPTTTREQSAPRGEDPAGVCFCLTEPGDRRGTSSVFLYDVSCHPTSCPSDFHLYTVPSCWGSMCVPALLGLPEERQKRSNVLMKTCIYLSTCSVLIEPARASTENISMLVCEIFAVRR